MTYFLKLGFPPSSISKEIACNAGDPGSIPGLGRSPGEGNGNPLQYSCLENSMDRGAWWATVHGVTHTHTQVHYHRLLEWAQSNEWYYVNYSIAFLIGAQSNTKTPL